MPRVWGPYGDDVNTDLLFPGKYTYLGSKPEEIIPHLLEDLDPEFSRGVQPGDVLLAGWNFGCGSSRNQPAVGFKALDLLVIAKSFSRIFYRASINLGLILVPCPPAVEAYRPGDEIRLDLDQSRVHVGERAFSFPPLAPYVRGIVEAGGLIEAIRARRRGA
jgi:3-isopropylmalate/(R)-2-methylmalate dehydratase small subunit